MEVDAMRHLIVAMGLALASLSCIAQDVATIAPPLAVRLQIYEQLSYMTERDFAMLTPQQKEQVICDRLAEKIDTQLDYERHGSHGVYNMDALRQAGPDYCRPYLLSIK
jgi:hypothetical protein